MLSSLKYSSTLLVSLW